MQFVFIGFLHCRVVMSYERIKKVVGVENGEEREGLKAKPNSAKDPMQANITVSFSLYIR